MSEPFLELNDLVQVDLLDGSPPRSYLSRVEELHPDCIVIAWPASAGALIPIAAGQIVAIYFLHEQSLWMLRGSVRKKRKEPVPAIVVCPSGPPLPMERRDDIRIRVPVAVMLSEKVVSIADFRGSGGRAPIEARTISISAGGFAIRHDAPLAPGALYDALVHLPESAEPLEVRARVVRCDPAPMRGAGKYIVAFAFSRIPEKVRARIVRFVFKAQMDEMQSVQ